MEERATVQKRQLRASAVLEAYAIVRPVIVRVALVNQAGNACAKADVVNVRKRRLESTEIWCFWLPLQL